MCKFEQSYHFLQNFKQFLNFNSMKWNQNWRGDLSNFGYFLCLFRLLLEATHIHESPTGNSDRGAAAVFNLL